MIDEDTPIELRTEAAVVMGSIAKGTEENVLSLIDEGCVSVLLKGKCASKLCFEVVFYFHQSF